MFSIKSFNFCLTQTREWKLNHKEHKQNKNKESIKGEKWHGNFYTGSSRNGQLV
jgi:hypothetical protein